MISQFSAGHPALQERCLESPSCRPFFSCSRFLGDDWSQYGCRGRTLAHEVRLSLSTSSCSAHAPVKLLFGLVSKTSIQYSVPSQSTVKKGAERPEIPEISRSTESATRFHCDSEIHILPPHSFSKQPSQPAKMPFYFLASSSSRRLAVSTPHFLDIITIQSALTRSSEPMITNVIERLI